MLQLISFNQHTKTTDASNTWKGFSTSLRVHRTVAVAAEAENPPEEGVGHLP